MLKQLQPILNSEKFISTFEEGSEEGSPEDRILIFLGTDIKQREQILVITAQEQLAELDAHEQESNKKSSKYYRIQFEYVFPFPVENQALTQVGSLILFLNKLIDFPGFQLDELEGEASFRYVWLTQDNENESPLIVNIVGVIKALILFFGQNIERLASGRATFNELLEEVVQLKHDFEEDQKNKQHKK